MEVVDIAETKKAFCERPSLSRKRKNNSRQLRTLLIDDAVGGE
jgi:hypothetical protein